MYFILNPSSWPEFVRHLRRGDPATVPLLLMASCGCMAFSQAIRIWLGPWSLITMTAMTSVVQILTTIGALILFYEYSTRLWRYGCIPFWRQRWWFELARLALLAGMIAYCTFMTLMVFELIANMGLLTWSAVLLETALVCGVAFFITATCGIAMTKLYGHNCAGRAYRCIQFFYLASLGCVGIFSVGICGLQVKAPVTMLFCLAAICLSWAVGLQLRNRQVRRIAKVSN